MQYPCVQGFGASRVECRRIQRALALGINHPINVMLRERCKLTGVHITASDDLTQRPVRRPCRSSMPRQVMDGDQGMLPRLSQIACCERPPAQLRSKESACAALQSQAKPPSRAVSPHGAPPSRASRRPPRSGRASKSDQRLAHGRRRCPAPRLPFRQTHPPPKNPARWREGGDR